ncbi:EAL domain-containing protein [Allohahella marinimesophila]|uniref:EAL domain-containing protein n=1 Tax=Allohahella marinimesophila TaxID=1054972 RepID=A0ABP7NXY7_9GAMM
MLAQAVDESSVHFEGWRSRQNGCRFFGRVSLSGLKDSEGKLLGFSLLTQDFTVTKQASDERILLRSILETALDPIVVIDERGIIETFNPAAERTFGYRCEDIIGLNVNTLMPAPHRAKHDSYLHRYLATGEAKIIGVGTQASALRKDGTEFPAEFGISEMIIDGRRKFTGVIRDISERRLSEAAIESRNHKLAEAIQRLEEEKMLSERMINSIPSIFYLFDANGRFLRWNKPFEVVTGYSADEVNRSHPLDYFMAAEQTLVAAAIQQTQESGHATVEARFKTKSGQLIPYWFTGARIDVDGEPHLAGIGVDMSDRLETEQALRLRNRAVEASPNGIALIGLGDEPGLIGYVNPALKQMLGLLTSTAVGQNWADIFFTNEEPERLNSLYAILGTGEEVHVTLRLLRSDGTEFWSDLYAAPVANDKGEFAHLVAVIVDITETKRYEEALEKRANFDELTGLANRNLLMDRLQMAMEHSRRTGQAVALMLIDLDNFKYINDTLGHGVGDQALQQAALRLQSCLRAEDTVARIGGDEFVIVVSEAVDKVFMAALMGRILETISIPVPTTSRQLQLTCSIGVSLFPENGEDVDTLYKHADIAMYQAKAHGRNNFWFFTEDLNLRLNERVHLEHSLRQALDGHQFTLLYQPQIDLNSGEIIGAEALLRWHHPELGLIEPDRFVPIAEDTGLIIGIGDWVMKEATRRNRRWQLDGLPPLVVAVNLSARQFAEADLVHRIETALNEADLDPRYLCLEITESHVMQEAEQAVQTLHQLKALGVMLSIDDFGTGYSSLSYLKKFPVDELKIDRSFVRDLHIDVDDAVIAEAIISLGHSLNIRVIAEGIEHEEQLDFLIRQGCDHGQGFFLGEPVSAEALEALIRQPRTAWRLVE